MIYNSNSAIINLSEKGELTIMIISHTVNWTKTCINISNRLSNQIWEKDIAPLIHLSERQVQHKLTGHPLTIDELYIFASFLGCSIDDLIVFDHDEFVEPERSYVTKRTSMEISTTIEIDKVIYFNILRKQNCEIQNLAEFLLYLHLIPEHALRDVVFRCYGNLYFSQQYFVMQMNYLYKTIPDNKAKEFADSYRNNVLRVKGDGELKYVPNECLEQHYWLSVLFFSGQINNEKYQSELNKLKESIRK